MRTVELGQCVIIDSGGSLAQFVTTVLSAIAIGGEGGEVIGGEGDDIVTGE